jgi:hypothetical protein
MFVCYSRKSHKKPHKIFVWLVVTQICVKPYKVCVEQCKVCASIICFFPCCFALKDVRVSIIILPTGALAEWMRACLATVRPRHRRPLDHILFGKYICDQHHCIYVYWPSVLYSGSGRVVTVWSSSREIGSSSPPRPTHFLAKISVFVTQTFHHTSSHKLFCDYHTNFSDRLSTQGLCGGSHKTIKSADPSFNSFPKPTRFG